MSEEVLEELAGPARRLLLIESAVALGGLFWVELEAFGLLGRLSSSGSLPAVEAMKAAGAARGHAWRAAQLEELLPVSSGLPGHDELAVSPGAAASRWVGSLAGLFAPEQEPRRLQWYRELGAAYKRRLVHASPASDAATVRVLGRLLSDIEAAQGA